jgi:hypothetical protein
METVNTEKLQKLFVERANLQQQLFDLETLIEKTALEVWNVSVHSVVLYKGDRYLVRGLHKDLDQLQDGTIKPALYVSPELKDRPGEWSTRQFITHDRSWVLQPESKV